MKPPVKYRIENPTAQTMSKIIERYSVIALGLYQFGSTDDWEVMAGNGLIEWVEFEDETESDD